MTLEWTEETLCRAARQMTQGLAAALPEEDVPSPAPAERLRRVTRRARWRRLGQRAAMIALTAVLANDPRPSYQHDPARVYGFVFAHLEVRFTVAEDTLTVCSVERTGK